MKKFLAVFMMAVFFAVNAFAGRHMQQPHPISPQSQHIPQYQPQIIQMQPNPSPRPDPPLQIPAQFLNQVRQQLQAQPERQLPTQNVPQFHPAYQPIQRQSVQPRQRIEAAPLQANTRGGQSQHKKSSATKKESLSNLSKRDLKEKIQELKGEKLNNHYDKMSKNELKKEVKVLKKQKRKAIIPSQTTSTESTELAKLSKKELRTEISTLKHEQLDNHYNRMSKHELATEVKVLENTRYKSAIKRKVISKPVVAQPLATNENLSNTNIHTNEGNAISQQQTKNSSKDKVEQKLVSAISLSEREIKEYINNVKNNAKLLEAAEKSNSKGSNTINNAVLMMSGEGEVVAVEKVGASFLEKSAARDAWEKTVMHHSWPKFLGGLSKQQLTDMIENEHIALHQDLVKFLKDKYPSMVSSSINPTFKIMQNHSLNELQKALAEFYTGPGIRYVKAAEDFFKQVR